MAKRPPAPDQSPLPPLLTGLALALVLVTLLLRTLTTGAGIELNASGTQLLFDSLALSAAATLAAGRVLASRPVLGVGAWVLAALGAWGLALVASALGAAHPELAWRSVLTPLALVALGLTAGDLAREPRLARLLVGFLLACVASGAALGLWWYAVEQPALQARFEAGDAELGQQLALFDPSFRQGLRERAFDRAAVGPYVIGNLLACACATALPLALAWTWLQRRRPLALAGALTSLLLLGGLVLSGSKGGLLAGLAGGVAFVVVHPALARHRRRLLVVAAALALLASLVGVGLYLRNPDGRGLGMSVQVRLEYWQAGLGMWGDAPLLGQGPNMYREWVSAYKSARSEEALHAHNLVVQTLAETGVLGLLTLAAFLGLWLRVAWSGSTSTLDPGADPPAEEAAGIDPTYYALGGYALGVLLLVGFGDYVSVQNPGQLLAVVLLLPGLVVPLSQAWPRESSPLLAPAALAGCVAFLVSAQLDFAFQHAGTLAIFACLLGLAPRLGGPPAVARQPRWASLAVAGGLGLLTVTLVCVVVPGALQADTLRTEARELHFEAALKADEGQAQESRALLERAAEAFGGSLETYPWSATTWREQAATLDGLGDVQAAASSLRASLARNPRAHATWLELGELLAREGRHDEAITALDQALACYPHHPGLLLEAGAVRVQAGRASPPGPTRDVLFEQGLDLLARAEQASETTRLVLRKLTPAQRERLGVLRREAGG